MLDYLVIGSITLFRSCFFLSTHKALIIHLHAQDLSYSYYTGESFGITSVWKYSNIYMPVKVLGANTDYDYTVDAIATSLIPHQAETRVQLSGPPFLPLPSKL